MFNLKGFIAYELRILFKKKEMHFFSLDSTNIIKITSYLKTWLFMFSSEMLKRMSDI